MIDWYFAGKKISFNFPLFWHFYFLSTSFSSIGDNFSFASFGGFVKVHFFEHFARKNSNFWHLIGFSSDLEYQWVSNRVKIAAIWAIWKKAKFNMRVDVWLCDGLEKCWAKIKDSLKLCRMRQLGLANFWAIFSPPFLVTLYSVWIRDDPPHN